MKASYSQAKLPSREGASKKILLFSRFEDEPARSPTNFGKHVRVGENFLIVHPNSKHPAREVIFGDSDYLSNVRLDQQSKSSRPASGGIAF